MLPPSIIKIERERARREAQDRRLPLYWPPPPPQSHYDGREPPEPDPETLPRGSFTL